MHESIAKAVRRGDNRRVHGYRCGFKRHCDGVDHGRDPDGAHGSARVNKRC